MSNQFIMQKGNRGASLNSDRNSYNAQIAMRRRIAEENNKNEEINNLKEQIDQMKQDQQDIKELLLKLLEKNK